MDVLYAFKAGKWFNFWIPFEQEFAVIHRVVLSIFLYFINIIYYFYSLLIFKQYSEFECWTFTWWRFEINFSIKNLNEALTEHKSKTDSISVHGLSILDKPK